MAEKLEMALASAGAGKGKGKDQGVSSAATATASPILNRTSYASCSERDGGGGGGTAASRHTGHSPLAPARAHGAAKPGVRLLVDSREKRGTTGNSQVLGFGVWLLECAAVNSQGACCCCCGRCWSLSATGSFACVLAVWWLLECGVRCLVLRGGCLGVGMPSTGWWMESGGTGLFLLFVGAEDRRVLFFGDVLLRSMRCDAERVLTYGWEVCLEYPGRTHV